MGTGSAAGRAPGETGDEPGEGGPAGAGAEARWDRMVPPYVDDPATRGRQQREQEPQPAGADEPYDDAAQAGATAGSAASAWSAWSSARAGDQDAAAHAGEAGRDSMARDERASLQETAGADAEAGAAGETGGHEAEAVVPGHDAADETADRAEPGGAAPGGAERPGDAGGPGETAGPAAEAQRAAEPGSTREAAETGDAADSGEGDRAAGADGATSPDNEVTVVPGVPRYHRRGCILIRFLSDGDLETTTSRAAEAAGSVPCKACQPDKPASADF